MHDDQHDAGEALRPLASRAEVFADTHGIVVRVAGMARPGDHVLVMSNGGFEGIHQRLLNVARDTGRLFREVLVVQ